MPLVGPSRQDGHSLHIITTPVLQHDMLSPIPEAVESNSPYSNLPSSTISSPSMNINYSEICNTTINYRNIPSTNITCPSTESYPEEFRINDETRAVSFKTVTSKSSGERDENKAVGFITAVLKPCEDSTNHEGLSQKRMNHERTTENKANHEGRSEKRSENRTNHEGKAVFKPFENRGNHDGIANRTKHDGIANRKNHDGTSDFNLRENKTNHDGAIVNRTNHDGTSAFNIRENKANHDGTSAFNLHEYRTNHDGTSAFNLRENKANHDGTSAFNLHEYRTNHDGRSAFNLRENKANHDGTSAFNLRENKANHDGRSAFNLLEYKTNHDGTPAFNLLENKTNHDGTSAFNLRENKANHDGTSAFNLLENKTNHDGTSAFNLHEYRTNHEGKTQFSLPKIETKDYFDINSHSESESEESRSREDERINQGPRSSSRLQGINLKQRARRVGKTENIFVSELKMEVTSSQDIVPKDEKIKDQNKSEKLSEKRYLSEQKVENSGTSTEERDRSDTNRQQKSLGIGNKKRSLVDHPILGGCEILDDSTAELKENRLSSNENTEIKLSENGGTRADGNPSTSLDHPYSKILYEYTAELKDHQLVTDENTERELSTEDRTKAGDYPSSHSPNVFQLKRLVIQRPKIPLFLTTCLRDDSPATTHPSNIQDSCGKESTSNPIHVDTEYKDRGEIIFCSSNGDGRPVIGEKSSHGHNSKGKSQCLTLKNEVTDFLNLHEMPESHAKSERPAEQPFFERKSSHGQNIKTEPQSLALKNVVTDPLNLSEMPEAHAPVENLVQIRNVPRSKQLDITEQRDKQPLIGHKSSHGQKAKAKPQSLELMSEFTDSAMSSTTDGQTPTENPVEQPVIGKKSSGRQTPKAKPQSLALHSKFTDSPSFPKTKPQSLELENKIADSPNLPMTSDENSPTEKPVEQPAIGRKSSHGQKSKVKPQSLALKSEVANSPSHPITPEGHAALFMKPAQSSDKKRRDSVTAMPSRSGQQPLTPTKQRRVSLTPNPSIPKRRMSVKDKLHPVPAKVPSFSHSLKEVLKKEGFSECHVTESLVTIECPVYTVTKGGKVTQLTDEASLESALHRVKPGVILVKDFDGADKIKQATSSTMPPSNTHDVIKHMTDNQYSNKPQDDVEPIENCIKEMTINRTNYQIQLNGCETVGKYADKETLQVLLSKQEAIQCVFNAMQQFSDKENLQRTACQSILQMASASEANCEMVCRCGGNNILINTFRSYSDNIAIMRTVLTIWGYLSVTEELCYEMIQHGVHSEVLGAMSRRTEDADVVHQCCFILGNLVITEETAKQIMLVGGVHTVISVMNKFPHDATILENGCRALGSFAAFDNTCLDVAQAGGTKTVVDVLQDTTDNVTVQECALWALACLTSMGDTCEELIQLEGTEAVFTSMEKYKQEETIQEYGVRIICNIAALETRVDCIGCCRVLDILLHQLKEFTDSLMVLDHSLAVLSHTLITKDIQRYFLSKNGVHRVVTTMASFPEHPAIQEHGCRILGNMAVFESLRKETEEGGASEAVINAMLSLQMSRDIQEYGCMALMNLTADIDVNKIQVMKNGGVCTLLTCIRNFENNKDILLSALKTLGNIITLEGVCHDILDDNGLRTLISLSYSNIDSLQIQVFSSMVLCGLSALPDLEFSMTESIDETLMYILEKWDGNADICLYVCQAMENMIGTENGFQIFTKDDRLPVVLKCMSDFTYHADIQQACCKIIAVLAMECESDDVVRPESAESVLRVMKTFKQHAELQIICCGALSCLLESNCDIDKTIVQNKGVEAISTALHNHPSEHRLHVLALMVLGSLAPAVQGDQVDELHKIILMAMGRFMENHEIQTYGCTAICRLQFKGDNCDVENILCSVRHALRRHSSQGEVLKSAGSLLRRMSEAGHSAGVQNVLESALPTLPDFFWRSVRQVKAPNA